MKYLVSAELKEASRKACHRHEEIKKKRAEEGKSFDEGDWIIRVVTDSIPMKVIAIIDTDRSRIMEYALDYEPMAKITVTPVFDYGEARERALELLDEP